MNPSDPARPDHTREHLANERTFLAWVRTALGLIGLGFVLARMGLFLRQLADAGLAPSGRTLHVQAGGEFLASGVIFLLIGLAVCGWAGHRYATNRDSIESGTFNPAGGSIRAITAIVVAGGLVIAAMVVWRTLFGGPVPGVGGHP